MRIALLPSAYAPMVGGVEELTRHLARELRLGGDEVEVWTPALPGRAEREEVAGTVVCRFPMPLPPARPGPIARFPLQGARALATLRRAVRRFRPELLHVQCFSVNGVYATAVGALEGLPVVVSLQGETVMDDDDIFDRSVALRTGLRLAVRRAAAVTGCSQFVLDDAVARFGLGASVGSVIFNGVDLSEPKGAEVAPPFDRVVLGLGRQVWKKGFDLLIDAFAAVAEQVPDVGLVLAGEGPHQAALRERAQRLGVAGRVHFAGALDRDQVDGMMRTADVFVMPSRLEPFGIVVLEAWRAGCPVVTSAVGGTREFVRDGVDGLLADPHDTPVLAERVTRLLTDGHLRAVLAANASARVRDFDWSRVAARYRELYDVVPRPAGAGRRSR